MKPLVKDMRGFLRLEEDFTIMSAFTRTSQALNEGEGVYKP